MTVFQPGSAPTNEAPPSTLVEKVVRPRSAQSLKNALRTEEYLARAARSTELAEGSNLPQVRQKHELAASVWLQLANIESQPLATLPKVFPI